MTKIYSKKSIPIQQPQSSIVRLGIHSLRLPLVGKSISRGVTQYCNRFKKEKNSRKRIRRFAETYNIEPETIRRCQGMTKERCWEQFSTLNDFFTRERVGLPRTRRTQRELVSPADAYTVFLTQPRFWIKGSEYSTGLLMKGNDHAKLADLTLLIFRLAPHHYHRVHTPVYGWVTKISVFGTEYNSVDPLIVQSKSNVLTQNVRVVLEIQTAKFGKVYMAIVGATCVGSIVLTHPKILQALHRTLPLTDREIQENPIGFTLEKAPLIRVNEELGYFQYGGSTVILGVPMTHSIHLSSIGKTVLNHTLFRAETELEVGDSLLIH